MTKASRSGRTEKQIRRFALLAAALSWLIGGCAHQENFRAASLPVEFQAPSVENPRTVDLSKLASFAVSNELIDRGDVLELTMGTGYERLDTATSPIRVADDGMANIPLLGKVELAGLELEAAEQAIAAACVQRGIYRNPHVTVTMKRQRMNKVTVVGAVNTPGVYDLPRGSSALLAALVAAGGLSDEAGGDVEIRRPQRGTMPRLQDSGEGPNRLAGYTLAQPVSQAASIRVNLVSAAREGRGGYYLEDGDVVMVDKRDPKPVHVLGLVKKPGQYELPVDGDMHVLDAIALAGGMDNPWADKLIIIRQVAGKSNPVVIETSVKEAKHSGRANLRLAAGDTVSIEDTPATRAYQAVRGINMGVNAPLPIF